MLYHEINKLKSAEKTKSENQPRQETPPVTPESTVVSQVVDVVSFSKFDKEERAILQILVRYGECILYYDIDNNNNQIPVLVSEFIIKELERDKSLFSNDIHKKIYDEYKLQRLIPDFIPERYFLYHSDSQISKLMTELVIDKYTLSKVHSKIKKIETDVDRLFELVPRVIFEFKNSLVLDLIRQKLIEMKTASEQKNNTRINEIMQEMVGLEKIKNKLSKSLGERIIIKI
jgi:DNA primase